MAVRARAATIAQDEARYKESLRLEAAQAKLDKLLAAQAFGTPLGADIGAENTPVGG